MRTFDATRKVLPGGLIILSMLLPPTRAALASDAVSEGAQREGMGSIHSHKTPRFLNPVAGRAKGVGEAHSLAPDVHFGNVIPAAVRETRGSSSGGASAGGPTSSAPTAKHTNDPASTTITVRADPAPVPLAPSLVIDINLSKQLMTVTENGRHKYSWSVSSADWGYSTPTGTFNPTWMARMWYSRQYDYAPMPHSIFFTGGTAIHATYATEKLGQPASHGCVRLAPQNAKTLYQMVSEHGKGRTRITVHGAPRYRALASDHNGRGAQDYRAFQYRNRYPSGIVTGSRYMRSSGRESYGAVRGRVRMRSATTFSPWRD